MTSDEKLLPLPAANPARTGSMSHTSRWHIGVRKMFRKSALLRLHKQEKVLERNRISEILAYNMCTGNLWRYSRGSDWGQFIETS